MTACMNDNEVLDDAHNDRKALEILEKLEMARSGELANIRQLDPEVVTPAPQGLEPDPSAEAGEAPQPDIQRDATPEPEGEADTPEAQSGDPSGEDEDEYLRQVREWKEKFLRLYKGRSLFDILSGMSGRVRYPLGPDDRDSVWDLFLIWDSKQIEDECLDTALRLNAFLFSIATLKTHRFSDQHRGDENQLAEALAEVSERMEALVSIIDKRYTLKRKQQILEEGY